MDSLAELRRQLQARGQLVPLRDFGRLPSGFPALDRILGGGYLRGGITELVGPPGSGGSSVALGAAIQLSRAGGLVALLDPTTSFDPISATRSGAVLERFLWVRPRRLAEALEAVDLLVESGSFPLVLLDLACLRPGRPPPPPGVWARLAGRLRKEPVALLVLSGESLVGALAKATLVLTPGPCRRLPHGSLPVSRQIHVEVRRNRVGPVGEAVTLEFSMAPAGLEELSDDSKQDDFTPHSSPDMED